MRLLINQIKRELRVKKREPFRPSAFSVVKMIAEEYGLVESFFEKPVSLPRIKAPGSFMQSRLKAKKKLQIPPFVLADREQYLLAMKIVDTFVNPYLPFARSPDEIVLSEHLYSLNPSIRPELLEKSHFESLFLVESAKKQVETLSSAVKNMTVNENRLKARGAGSDISERAAIEAMRSKIKALKEFILFCRKARPGKPTPRKAFENDAAHFNASMISEILQDEGETWPES